MNATEQHIELLRIGVCPHRNVPCGDETGYVCIACVRDAVLLERGRVFEALRDCAVDATDLEWFNELVSEATTSLNKDSEGQR